MSTVRNVWHWLVVERFGWRRPSPIAPEDAAQREDVLRRLMLLEQAVALLSARVDVIDRLERL